MKNYVYSACLIFTTMFLHATTPWYRKACCNTRAMNTPPQARTFEQREAFVQSQYADNPERFRTHVQVEIAQREQAIEDAQQRQNYLEKLHAQLNDENDDSQDDISLDAIISAVVPDTSYIRLDIHKSIQANYDEAWNECYPDSATCAYEKAYLAYICAQAIEEANDIRRQEIEKLKAMLD
jgi:hypothetical protein